MVEPGPIPHGLSADEQRIWFELQAWQREFVRHARSPRSTWDGAVPPGAPGVAGVPGVGPGPTGAPGLPVAPGPDTDPAGAEAAVPGALAARLQRSLQSVTAAIADPAAGARVAAQHRRVLGHEPTPSTLLALDVRVLDRIASRGAIARTATSASVGGVTGSLAAGAGVAGAATGGLALGAAVGVAAVAAVVDAAFVVLQASRTTARTAAVYGFDPRDPDEQAAVLAIVGAALARRRDRAAALGRSHHIAGLIAARAVHGSAPSEAARLLTRQLHHSVVLSLSGQQVRRGVPVLGAALGSAATARAARHVDEVARQLYRDRFLRRRSVLAQLTAGQRGQIGAGPTEPGAAARS